MQSDLIEGYDKIIGGFFILIIFLIAWIVTSRMGRRNCSNCPYYGNQKSNICPICGYKLEDSRRGFRDGPGGGYS